MKDSSQKRFWIVTIAATSTGVLFVLSLVWRDWIEIVFNVDPDQHDGTLEWFIVAGLLVVTVVLSALARTEWRTAKATAA